MTSILVIGGSGFVGRALIPVLVQAGHQVSVLNRGNQLVVDATQILADRNDPLAMQRAAARFDVVIDTSAYTPAQTKLAFDTFGAHATHWIQLSSAAVYQPIEGRYPSEIDMTGGAAVWGDYGVEKSNCDDFLLAQDRCPVTILRPPYLYGPQNAYDRETFVWSRILSGRPVIVPGTGQAALQFLHVTDLAQVFLRCIDRPSPTQRVYNVADPAIVRSQDWVEMLAGIAGRPVSTLLGDSLNPSKPARSYFPFRDVACALDVSRVQAELNWRPSFNLEDGFRQTFESYEAKQLAGRSPMLEAEVELLQLR